MNSFSTDANKRPAVIREGLPVGGLLAITRVSSDREWHRVLPHGNNAAVVANEPDQLNIGNLRADILTLIGWKIKILNSGNVQERRIVNYESPNITVEGTFDSLSTISTGTIQYVLYPEVILPFGVKLHPDTGNSVRMQLGFTTEDAYTPTRIVPHDIITKNSTPAIFQTKYVDRLFYQVSAGDDTSFSMCWGEHYVS